MLRRIVPMLGMLVALGGIFCSRPAVAEVTVPLSRDAAPVVVGAWNLRLNKAIVLRGKVYDFFGQIFDDHGQNRRASMVTFDVRGWDRFTAEVGVPEKGGGGYFTIEVDGNNVFWKAKEPNEAPSTIDIKLTDAQTLTMRKSDGTIILGNPRLTRNADPVADAVESADTTRSVISFLNFGSVASLNLQGCTKKQGQALHLTTSGIDAVGVAWYREKILVANGFTTSFVVQYPGDDTGNEGFSFNIQNIGPTTAATEHGLLDRHSLSVCFDLQQGGDDEILDQGNIPDFNNNHVEILADGVPVAMANLDIFEINLRDGATHQVDITSDGKTLSLTIDALPVLTNVPAPIRNATDADGGAWLGFGARTSPKYAGEGPALLGWRVGLP